MFIITYNEQRVEVNSVDEAMALINKISSEKLVENQLVAIDSEDFGSLEVGLGLGDESLLLYVPESEEDDLKISCNSTVDRAKSEEVEIDGLSCAKSNMVSLTDALEVVAIFLNNGDIFEKVDWYSY